MRQCVSRIAISTMLVLPFLGVQSGCGGDDVEQLKVTPVKAAPEVKPEDQPKGTVGPSGGRVNPVTGKPAGEPG
jgi:hypothetical protein